MGIGAGPQAPAPHPAESMGLPSGNSPGRVGEPPGVLPGAAEVCLLTFPSSPPCLCPSLVSVASAQLWPAGSGWGCWRQALGVAPRGCRPMRASRGGQWLGGLFEISPEQTALSLRSPRLSALHVSLPFPASHWVSAGTQALADLGSSCGLFVSPLPASPVLPLGCIPCSLFLPLGFPSSSAASGPVCISPLCLWKGAAPLWTRHHQLWLLWGDLLSPCHLAQVLGDSGGFSWSRTRQWLSLEPV